MFALEGIIQWRMPLDGLLKRYEACLMEMEYCLTTRYDILKWTGDFISKHLKWGYDYMDKTTISQFMQELDDRRYNGAIGEQHYRKMKRLVERFIRFAYLGDAGTPPNPKKGAKQELSEKYETLCGMFLQSLDVHPNTWGDIRWVTRLYFSWLEVRCIEDIKEAEAIHVQKFLLECSQRFSINTMYDVQLYLKKLYGYLLETGYTKTDLSALLSFRVSREHKIYPPIPKDDIAKLLESIDRSTIKGKRNYAIMLLGTVLGLRACDVVALKKTDIDWVRGEIRVVQKKTSNPIILPLTADVAEALMDYILEARPASDEKQIFLHVNAPHTPLETAVAIGNVYKACCKKAGLKVCCRFHNLRRSLGTSMVSNGVSVMDVAQVFGDQQMDSTKPYLSADMAHLKQCALPLTGIEPKKGRPKKWN